MQGAVCGRSMGFFKAAYPRPQYYLVLPVSQQPQMKRPRIFLSELASGLWSALVLIGLFLYM